MAPFKYGGMAAFFFSFFLVVCRPMAPKKKLSRLRDAAAGASTTTTTRSAKLRAAVPPIRVAEVPLPADGAFERAAAAFADLRRSLNANNAAPQPATASFVQPLPPPQPPPPPTTRTTSTAPAFEAAAIAAAATSSAAEASAAAPPPIAPLSPSDDVSDDIDDLPSPVAHCGRSLAGMGHSLEAAQHQSAPAQGAAAIDALRRNVQALYNDARAHMRMERDAATHVTRVQTQVAELQRAFRHLAEVAVEELEELREDVERNAAALVEAVRLANEVKPLKSAVATLERTSGDLAREVATERARVKKADAERDQRLARLETEMGELRAARAGDRQALNAAVSTVRDLSTTMSDTQASSEASQRAVHETLAALGRRQVALEVEVEALGTTFRRRALGSASNGSARAPACGRDADGEGLAGLDTGLGTGAEASGSALASTNGCSSGGHASAPSGMSPLPRTRHFGFGLDVERNAPPHIRYQGLPAPSAPGGGTRTAGGGDPIYAKALAEARRELTERVAVGGRRGRGFGWT